jgi:hypothetical protein
MDKYFFRTGVYTAAAPGTALYKIIRRNRPGRSNFSSAAHEQVSFAEIHQGSMGRGW